MIGGGRNSMHPWSRVTVQEYRRLPLRAHDLLHDVPVHDVWQVSLPNGGPGRTMKDVRDAFELARQAQGMSPPVRALFALRWFVGRVFKWDRRDPARDASFLRDRLSDADRQLSMVEPGTRDGHFTI